MTRRRRLELPVPLPALPKNGCLPKKDTTCPKSQAEAIEGTVLNMRCWGRQENAEKHRRQKRLCNELGRCNALDGSATFCPLFLDPALHNKAGLYDKV